MKNAWLILFFNIYFCPAFCQSHEKQIDSLMRSYYKPGLPGAVIAVELHHKTFFKKGYGDADLLTHTPITPEENFNIGSLTKQFTAFAVLDLFYKGRFKMDDSIGKFLPLATPLSSVRISQLLSHCSGIPDHYGFVDTSLVKHAADKDVLVALQKADTFYFPPGTHYRYSNTAYCLLGLLIEKWSGISYPDYLQQNIFSPLGIKDATVFQIGEKISKRVIGYDLSPAGQFIRSDADESIFFSTEADGGIYISMDNYMKWCQAIETGKFSHTPIIRQAWSGQTLVDTMRGLWYGNGWFVQHPGTTPEIIYHTGFNGGFRTVVWMIPSMEYCIAIFSNRGDIDLEDLVKKVNQILHLADNSFIKSGPLESFYDSWPIFAPCKETRLYSTLFIRNWNAKDMVLN